MGGRKAVCIKLLAMAAAATTVSAFLSPYAAVSARIRTTRRGGGWRWRSCCSHVARASAETAHGRRCSTSGRFESSLLMSGSDWNSEAEAAAAAMDTLIKDLANATDGDSFLFKVSKSVKQVAQPAFFLRLAELAGQSTDPKHKAALEKLAATVTAALEKLVEFAEEKINDSASILQIILSSAAEKDGEFLVPLSEQRLSALRQSVRIHRDSLDNNFLMTVQAWMAKSRKESMAGMVTILQKVLQLYASEEILFRQNPVASAPTSGVGFGEKTEGESSSSGSTKAKTPANLLLEEILSTDEAKWDGILSGLSAPGRSMTGGVSKESLLGAIQVAVATVVLQEENGSLAQRVQAEFLSELCKRIEKACPERPPRLP